MVFPSQIILSHIVTDHGFANANKIAEFKKKEFLKHWIWMVLILLAFTFDTVLKTPHGFIVILIYILSHIGFDFYRRKNFLMAELLGLVTVIILNIIEWNELMNSYITPEFSTYILGMTIVSVIPTTIFRYIKLIPIESNDSDGIFERLLVFVLINASQYLWAFLILVMVLIYRMIFTKYTRYWIISPIVGIALSMTWKILTKITF